MTANIAPLRHPVVLRFEGMHPSDLPKYEFHRKRLGGDIGHVDRGRSHLNKPLTDNENWVRDALDLLQARKDENFHDELVSLKKRKRKKDIIRRAYEGPRDPWRPTRHGPLREVILTANKKWFEAIEIVGDEADLSDREELFEERAMAWLRKTFGEDLIHARADRDEAAYHIHAVIMPWKRITVGGVERWMLQPSKHAVIKDYELAQDEVGQWFSGIGLTRGKRRKQAFRDAVAKGETPPKRRLHVRPVEYRRRKDIRQAEARRKLDARAEALATRESAAGERMAEGAAIIAGASGIADGSLEVETTKTGARLRPAADRPAGPAVEIRLARLRASPIGHGLIARVMAGAMARIRTRAEAEAKAAARAALAREIAEIGAARDALAGLVELLPARLRERFTTANKALFARLFGLRERIGGDDDSPASSRHAPGGRNSGGDRE